MSEASKHVLAWREQKRQEGYMPVTVWIPAKIKNAMTTLAFSRHQDLGELIIEAFQAWSPAKSVKTAAPVDLRQLEALVAMKVAEALAHQRVPSGPTPGPAAAAVPPAPAGMKQCSDPTHRPYDARKKECPHHARERKQRSRANQAKERQGEVPA